MTENLIDVENKDEKKSITLLGAIFIGIDSMVGAGSVAGAAVWVSFLVGGIIALLQGYSCFCWA